MLIVPSSTLTPPTDSAITLGDAKRHLRMDHTSDEDTYIQDLIYAAEEYVKSRTGIGLGQTTYESTFSCFPEGDRIYLQYPPVSSATVTTLDSLNVSTAFTGFKLVNRSHVASYLQLNYGAIWPTTTYMADAVTVTYTSGFAPGLAPEAAKHAIRLLVATWFLRRESVQLTNNGQVSKAAEHALDALCRQLKTWRFSGNVEI